MQSCSRSHDLLKPNSLSTYNRRLKLHRLNITKAPSAATSKGNRLEPS